MRDNAEVSNSHKKQMMGDLPTVAPQSEGG